MLSVMLGNEKGISAIRSSFDEALPFRHVKIENFLEESLALRLSRNFPSKDKLSRHYNGLNEQKSEGANFSAFDTAFSEVRKLLSSKEFCDNLSKMTGIEGLFTTDDALGSGVHQGRNGSFLDVHIDFNIHHKRNLHRRLNLLIFLNENWKESYGGKLELWNEDVTKLEQSFSPIFNRCVMFETSETSFHGYSKISVPENITRKSFYVYYYTPINDYKGKFHDTVFKARPQEGTVKKVKTNAKEWLKNTIKRMLYNLKNLGKNAK